MLASIAENLLNMSSYFFVYSLLLVALIFPLKTNETMDSVSSSFVYLRVYFEELSERDRQRERGRGSGKLEKWCRIKDKRKETDKVNIEFAWLLGGSSSRSVT